MALGINTNVMSLTAQRQLSDTNNGIAQAMERLSSGLRINSAKDDAAGLAISERFTTQIRGLNQAVRNANDGISLSQTAEGAMVEITNNLQRIRELAVQSANATNSDSDRAALDNEVQQRLQEIDRIAAQTSFNGRNVLDGSFGSASFQVGANVGQTIDLALGSDANMRLSNLGAVSTAASNDLSGLITEASDAVATTSLAGGPGTFTQADIGNSGEYTLTVGGVDIVSVTTGAAATDTVTQTDLQDGLDSAPVQTALTTAGITYTGSFTAGDIVFSKTDGTDFTIAETKTAVTNGTFANAGFVASFTNGTEAVSASPLTVSGLTIQLGESSAVNVANGDYSSAQALVDAVNTALGGNATASLNDAGTVLSFNSSETITIGGADAGTVFTATEYTAGGNMTTVNVNDVTASNDAINRVDSALTSVSELRSTFGAIQNRFESTIANLQTTSENLAASRGRIQDADFAAETAALTKSQILQQAGIAMLSQANAQPQSVLALLQ
jgi:flagellin